jgi:type 1 glutamine amidotransferase
MQRVLLFTRTTGYRHESIPAGVAALRELADDAGVELDHSEDGGVFTAENLARYAATIWLDVSGDVLEEEQRATLSAFVRGGGGFAGIHAASDAEWSWPEFEQIIGARFRSHPNDALQLQTAQLRVIDPGHPSTRSLPDPWSWTDEWYVYTSDPSDRVEVLLEVDESTYDTDGAPMGARHPISWHGTFGAGRTWYTALGHREEYFSDPLYRGHLWGGIDSVLR